MFRILLIALAALLVFRATAMAASLETYTDPAKTPPQFKLQGEYEGELTRDGKTAHYGAQVIALSKQNMQLVLYHGGLPGDGWSRADKREKFDGKLVDNEVASFSLKSSPPSILAHPGKLSFTGDNKGTLLQVTRKSPSIGAKPPPGAIVLFDGSGTDKFKGAQLTPERLFMPAAGRRGAVTKDAFGDVTLHVEFRTPLMPDARGQGRGNSGVYVQDRYEVQILDSFGLEGEDNECGGLYKIRQPKVNMCFPPLVWQTYDIDFTAARYKGGNKVQNARITVKHNGVVIQDNVELPAFTAGGEPEGSEAGPLHLQWHGDPVTFRNIWIVPKKS